MTETIRMIWEILLRRERLQFLAIMGMVVVMSAFEMIGVAAVLPFLQVLSDPGTIDDSRMLSLVYDGLGFENTRRFSVFLGFAVFAVVVIGLCVRALTTYAITRFSLMRAYAISARLLRGYLRQPYSWFLSRNSAELGRSVLQEVDGVVGRSILPMMQFVASAGMSIFIVGLLLLLDPWVALGAFALLFGVYAGVYVGLRGILARVGHERVLNDNARYRVAQEATGGIKEVKALGLEQNFLSRFRAPARRYAEVQTTAMLIGELPRFVIEGVAFGGVVLLALGLLITRDGDLSTMLPTLGMTAVAGFKLFPALQKAYHQLSRIRFQGPGLKMLHRDILALDDTGEGAERTGIAPLPLRESLEMRGISYHYPDTDRSALDGLDLTIPARSTVGIVGGSGAGKTTLVDIVLGLLTPQEGALHVDGRPIDRERLRAWQKSLGYVPQSIFLSDDTVTANIAFGLSADEIDNEAVERAARAANLHEFIMEELPAGYRSVVGERGVRLSGGQRQRIGIARALYNDPEVLILDEATSALDTLTEAEVMRAVRALGGRKTIVMIAHRLVTVQDCDTIFLLENGRVADAGDYATLMRRNATFRRMAGA